MLHHIQVRLGVRTFHRSCHDLGASLAYRVSREVAPLIVHLRRLFKEDFAEDFFLLVVCVVIFHIVVMGLVEDCAGVVVAVWVFVPDSPHLVHDLGLGSVGPQGDSAGRTCTPELGRLEDLLRAHVLGLGCEILTSQ